MRLMAILALHVHRKVNFVFADSRRACMTPQTRLDLRPHFTRNMRLVALITIELHWRGFRDPDFYGFFDHG